MFDIVTTPISIDDVMNQVMHRNAGAVVTFIGTVREMTGEKQTLFLQYEAYESMAQSMLAKIGKKIRKQWPDTRVAIVHRIGRLEIGDIAVAIAVSSPHRQDAYEANRYAIEQIKKLVPIWKRENWKDGNIWVGNQEETVSLNDAGSVAK